MMEAATESYPRIFPANWSRAGWHDSLTAVGDEAYARIADLIMNSQLLRSCSDLERVLPTASLKSACEPDLLSDQQCSFTLEKVPSQGSATAILQITVQGAAKTLFQDAEDKLSARTEMTAQYALKLLRRLEVLVDAIRPSRIYGRVLASVDADDGAATLEWILNRSRLGFVLDPEGESSWFIVLPSGASKSGYLYGPDGLKSLRGLLEEFLAAGE